MGLLKFIGNGCAFNPKNGCNSAFILENNNLYLFDCGGDVFSRLKELNILTTDLKNIIVFITHTHSDHIGSLSDLIYYSHYILNLKNEIKIIGLSESILKILEINGVPINFFNFNLINEINQYQIFKLKYQAYITNHYSGLTCCGYLLNINNQNIYFSGDSNEIPQKIYEKFLNNEIDEFYQDTCSNDFENNPHFCIEKLKEIIPLEFRPKMYCMHLDESLVLSDEIIENGFNKTINEFEKNKKKAIYAGSFDPITIGHKQILEKASKMFDEVIIAVLINKNKNPVFSLEEKVNLIKKCTSHLKNVKVKTFDGLLVDFALNNNANILIRGLRSVSDFENEISIAMTNKKLNEKIETVFLLPNIENQYISSSLAREIGFFNGDLSWIIPSEILDEVTIKLKK